MATSKPQAPEPLPAPVVQAIRGVVVSAGAVALVALLSVADQISELDPVLVGWASVALIVVATVPALLHFRSYLRSLPVALVGLTALGGIAAAVVDAVAESDSGHYLAAAAGVLAAVVVGTLDHLAAPIAGQRAWPRWWALAAPGVWCVGAALWFILGGATPATYDALMALALAASGSAVGIAVLGSLVAASTTGGRDGITLCDAAVLPRLAAIDGLVLDGLGTVVDGKHVADVKPLDESHLRNLRWFAGALAHAGQDPVSHAIARLSVRGNVTAVSQSSAGLSGNVDRHPVRLAPPEAIGLSRVDVAEVAGETIGVEVDLRPLGTIRVEDSVRSTAPGAVAALAEMGIDPVLVSSASGPTTAVVMSGAGLKRSLPRQADRGDVADLAYAIEQAGGAPRTVAVVTDAASLAEDVLLLGPHGPAVRLAEAAVGPAAVALRLGQVVWAGLRRGRLIALGGHAVLSLLVLVGLIGSAVTALAVVALGVVVAAVVTAQLGSAGRIVRPPAPLVFGD